MDKSRAEAFSDGVLAVVITLLALDLKVDPASNLPLGPQLIEHWSTFAAFLVSFFVVGVIWVNHHALLAIAARLDRLVLFYNLLLLLFVTTIPFTTSTLADALRTASADVPLASLLYGASMEGMAISFTLIVRHLIRAGLTVEPVSRRDARRATLRFGIGTFVYPVVAVIGLISPPLMLAIYAGLAGYYMFEQTPILRGGPKAGDADDPPGEVEL
jgi:uncharacterized membrane protein